MKLSGRHLNRGVRDVSDDLRPPWHKDRRVYLAGVICLAAGVLGGWWVSGHLWSRQANWGDIPTWILAVLATVAGVYGVGQFRLLRRQVADAAAEADARALTERRRQAEDVELRVHGKRGPDAVAYVLNGSRRPITTVICKVMSKQGRQVVAEPDKAGSAINQPVAPAPLSPRQLQVLQWEPVTRWDTLRPAAICAFLFEGTSAQDLVFIAWFTDDAGFRWQLDEYLHLVPAGDGDEYVQ
jgi:hypothetical protein